MGFGKRIQRFTDVLLQRRQQIGPALLIGGLSVFQLSLRIFLQLVKLIDLSLNGFWIDGRGRTLQLGDLVLK